MAPRAASDAAVPSDRAPCDYSGPVAPQGFDLDGQVSPFQLSRIPRATEPLLCYLGQDLPLLIKKGIFVVPVDMNGDSRCKKTKNKKRAVAYVARNLGQGLRSGNTDSRRAQGFTTNPKRH